MLKKGMCALLASSLFIVPAIAAAQSETSVSRLYLINPDSTDIKGSIDALEAAIRTRDYRPSKQIGLMPSELPDRLGEPESRPFNFGPVSVNMLGCGNSAYAQIGTANGTDGGLIGNTSERIFGCLYLSKRGIRMSVIIEQKSSSSGSLMGSLMAGIKSVITGNDAEYSKKIFDAMLKEVKGKMPAVLVELEEFPGDVTRPDDEKVKALGLNTPVLPPVIAAPVVSVTKTPEIIAAAVQTETTKAPSAISPDQRIQLLRNLAELKKSGVLTDQEFTAEKRKILDN
jgi:hypothetical protein